MLNLAGGVVDRTYGGYVQGYVDGMGSDASFSSLYDIALDNVGNILVAGGSHTIRKITPAGNSISCS